MLHVYLALKYSFEMKTANQPTLGYHGEKEPCKRPQMLQY